MKNLPAFPKPSQMKTKPDPVKVFPDGREVCNIKIKTGMDEYMRRKRVMWERQGRKCGLQISPQCKARNGRLLIDEVQFEHADGRGSGGSKRDDRIVDENGKPMNMAACSWCNCLKGSRPLSAFDSYNVP